MGVRSDEIKRTLKPMLDFAPAIMQAAEIVAEAEQAEALLSGLAAQQETLRQESAALLQQAVSNRDATAKTAVELATAQVELAAQKTALIKALKVVQDKVTAAQAALDSVQTDYAAKLATLDEQLRVKQSALDGVDREMDTLRARFSR